MSKRLLASVVALGTAAAMVACSPQLENPSDQKVDTATSQDPASVGVGGGLGGATSSSDSIAADESTAQSTNTEAEETLTASALDSQSEVLFENCAQIPEARPAEVILDCNNPMSAIVNIEWIEWTETSATGRGLNPETGVSANVELSKPTNSGTVLAFSAINVDGKRVNP